MEPICWQLLTPLPVTDFAGALEKLRWYAQRFQIEVFHRTLQRGCRRETRQLRNAARLEACLAVDLVVAWRLVHLTKLGRQAPELPCTAGVEAVQWRVLVAVARPALRAAPPPPTLQEAVRMVASLGGCLGREHDGQPGVQCRWRGWQRLEDLLVGWQLAPAVLNPEGAVSSDRRYE